MALLGKADFIGENAGHQPGHAIHQGQGGQFSPGKDIIPDGDLFVHQSLQHPLVHPLVVAAEHADAWHGRQLHRSLLGQHRPLGGHID